MKKKSIIVLILVTFWFAYSTVTIGMYLLQVRNFYSRDIERLRKVIDHQQEIAVNYLGEHKTDELIDLLQRGRKLGFFDFFILKKKDQVLGFYNKNDYLEGVDRDYKVLNELLESDDYIIKTVAVHDYKLTIGIIKAEGLYYQKQLETHKVAIIQDLILITILVFLIVWMILKDIIQISKVLQSRSRSSLSNIQSLSKEAETLLQATGGYETVSEGLKSDNLLLASSLGPAIREEIKSGLTPPYDFPCTLARVDLNGYTQLFLQKEPKDLLFLLNQYFQKSRDLIERYDGLIYQYVGDETIFLFKGEDPGETAARALSAIRCLFEMAVQLKSPGLPQGLRLKASLVTGRLQFVKLDEGHAFNGLPLIESVRMLGQVSEKTENSLIFYADSLEQLQPFCEVTSSKTAVFKGFQKESHLLEVKQFTTLEQAFQKLPKRTISQYFRSDLDLVGILAKLKELISSDHENEFFNLLSPLRSMQVRETSQSVVKAYEETLSQALQAKLQEVPESKKLASLVALSQNLLQKEQVGAELQKMLELCENAKDPRVQANTLIAKAYFQLEVTKLKEKMKSASNRLAADAVLVSGQSDFNQALFERVEEFLKSQNPRFKASGLYLVAELIQFHFERDLVYLKANPYLRALALEVPKFIEHDEPLVQKRAKISYEQIQKLGLYEN